MEGNRKNSGTPSGFQYGRRSMPRRMNISRQSITNNTGNDDDLIIEENTVYEIDRECYERMKRQKKREK